jgi:hypothetical protein
LFAPPDALFLARIAHGTHRIAPLLAMWKGQQCTPVLRQQSGTNNPKLFLGRQNFFFGLSRVDQFLRHCLAPNQN